jgi:predicted aspartyl protease
VSFPFHAQSGPVILHAEIVGLGAILLRRALDTGATTTSINTAALVKIGYDPALATARVQVTTGSGVEYVPRLQIARLKALGQERMQFWVLSHTLPPSATIDGLLGLDFLRGQMLAVDFRQAIVSLS